MKISITGDSLFSSRNISQRIDEKIATSLKSADVNFTNAEFCTPQVDTPPAAGRGYVTAVRENKLDELKKLGFNLINFANNHTGDFGVKGILDTIQAAEKRNIDPIGIGRSLDEVHLPKFYDTKTGRIGIVAAATTRSEVFLASNAGNGVPARPGLNPLRWDRTYIVPEDAFGTIKNLSQQLGLTQSIEVGTRIERWQQLPNYELYLGSMYQEKLHFKEGDKYKVETVPNQEDLNNIVRQIADAKKRAHFVVFSLHTHEGINENWYADEPAEFVKQAAYQAIDAGADIVIGHGAHFLRGIELYHKKPIFYNLGSFLMEFEAGESIIPPEMYQAYQLQTNSLPSDLHQMRAYDNGELAGFNSDEIFSMGFVLSVDYTEKNKQPEYGLLPIDLRMANEDSLKRGIPVVAKKDLAQRMVKRIQKLSLDLGTKIEYDTTSGKLNFR